MKRRIFNFASLVSLLACIATVLLWMRSRSVFDRVTYFSDDGDRVELITAAGVVEIEWENQAWRGEGEARFSWRRADRSAYSEDWPDFDVVPAAQSRFRFGYYRWQIPVFGLQALGPNQKATESPPVDDRLLVFPLWAPLALAAVPPAIWLAAWRRLQRRARRGCCRQCGYDLRAVSERCPECGTAIPSEGGAVA